MILLTLPLVPMYFNVWYLFSKTCTEYDSDMIVILIFSYDLTLTGMDMDYNSFHTNPAFPAKLQISSDHLILFNLAICNNIFNKD